VPVARRLVPLAVAVTAATATRMEIKRLGLAVAAQLAWMRELLRVP